MLKVNDRITIPASEMSWDYALAGGPGGQNVNKVHSKAVLRWSPATSPSLPEPVRARLLRAQSSRLTTGGELVISSQRSRDRGRNVADCLEKLRTIIAAAAVPPKTRRPSKPTAASQARRLQTKLKRAATKRLRRKLELD